MTSTESSPNPLLGPESGVSYFNFDTFDNSPSHSQRPTAPLHSSSSSSSSQIPSSSLEIPSSNFSPAIPSNFELFKQSLLAAKPKHSQQASIVPELKVTPSPTITPLKSMTPPNKPLNINSLHSNTKFFSVVPLHITSINTIEEFERITHTSQNEDVVIVDLRPFNQYSASRVRDSLSICIPSTLLKRNSFNLSNIFKTMIVTQETTLKSKLQSAKDLHIVFYDSSSTIDHCSLQIYQVIKKFQEQIQNYDKVVELFFVNEGFNLFQKTKEIEESYIDTSSFKAVKSPDQACFSEFLLPSADPTSSFLMAMKSNQICSCDTYRDIASMNLPVFKNPDSIPVWLQNYTDANCVDSLVSKFKKIESSENRRLGASASLTRKRSMTPVESPNSPNSGNYNLVGPENGFKNRYPNILPYEHSRVRLVPSPLTSAGSQHLAPTLQIPQIVTTPTHNVPPHPSNLNPDFNSSDASSAEGLRKSSITSDDYFNANFINVPQVNEVSRYIATQAPLPSTIDDFWKVVWDNESEIIVSLTNISEYGVRKSDIYWQNSSFVELLEETEHFSGLDGLTVRKIQLTRRSKKRIVHQLHFTDWPDHGTVDPSKMVKLLEVKSQFINDKSSPVVVHCSAGCGRTGTFIAIDLILQAFKNYEGPDSVASNSLDIWKTSEDLVNLTVKQIRKQRILMVQSLEQFILCYETILHYFASLPTGVSPSL